MNWFRKTIFSSRFWLGKNKFKDQPSNLSVTVVIPAWNEEDFIGATIESVLKSTYPVNLIVVNDNSTDGTLEIAERYSDVCVLTTPTNQGSKSQALNYAIPFVDTDIFICVDADTILETDAIDRLIRAFNNDNVYVASGFVNSKGTSNLWQMGRHGEYIIGQAVVKSAQENLNGVLVASGCFFAVRTKFLKEHQFNHRTMAEDMDLTWVAMEQGYDVAFVQDAHCTVNDPPNWNLYNKQLIRWYSGLFQNIKQRRFDLFSKNPKLGIFAYSYILFNFLGLPLLTYMAIVSGFSLSDIAFVLSVGYMTLLIPALWHGISKRKNVLMYPIYVASMFVVSLFNFAIFIRCGYKELLTKDNLTIWVKGH